MERTNVGRTTFYLHYNSKDELFMSCHEAIVREFHVGSLYPHPLSRDALVSAEAPPGTIAAYQHLKVAWERLAPIFQGKDGALILRRIRDGNAEALEANLRAAFMEVNNTLPINVLANYLAGAQIALVYWWLEKRQPLTPENLAQTFHRLQRAAICEAFELRNVE